MKSKKYKDLTAADQGQKLVDKLVMKTSKDLFNVLKKFNPAVRWLIYGRVVASLFRSHFSLGLELVTPELIEAQKSLSYKKERSE
jgi:hypothetical protein